MFDPTSLVLLYDILSICLLFERFLTIASFSSTNERNVRRREDPEPWPEESISSGLCFLYCLKV
ncbi:hypothetical protein MtrunA17_Chr8g0370271 [Medicago truncatula]|uniref:Uncharacterized protein n=1 Tax=Medicago truncatula TaxID=3880 RepID=A0A396GQQ0_MEDTR|nr:hypothetical protein MtrunA17_Chr8g0370271 [Medicago truncatula]